MATGDLLEFYHDMLVAVFKRALWDACKRSDQSAIEFLDHQVPDWRQRLPRVKENFMTKHEQKMTNEVSRQYEEWLVAKSIITGILLAARQQRLISEMAEPEPTFTRFADLSSADRELLLKMPAKLTSEIISLAMRVAGQTFVSELQKARTLVDTPEARAAARREFAF